MQRLFGVALGVAFVGVVVGWFLRTDVAKHTQWTVINPTYVGMYGVSAAKDDHYELEMIGPDGALWFRESTPGVSLECVRPENIYPHTAVGDTNVGIRMHLEPPCVEATVRWWREQDGKMVGAVIGGDLVYVARMGGVFGHNTVTIPGIGNNEQVYALIQEIVDHAYAKEEQ